MHKNAAYREKIRRASGSSPTGKNCLFAALAGGGISGAGQLLFFLYRRFVSEESDAWLYVTLTLIFVSALLSALGLYDRIARYAGAGTLVPVTGFANAVISPALDTASEGMIPGVGAKIFTVAGPVILFGTLAGWLYGLILVLFPGAML